jgi:choline dehydrogenase-like flavoprotein
MIIDARTIPADDVVETDVCIIGAGIAGIALARELRGADYRVLLLESGGLEADEATLALSKGENVGLPYDRLEGARFRAFGGNSHTWSLELGEDQLGARLYPLDPIDFEARDWVPHSGWPFGRDHLEPYYRRSYGLFGVDAPNVDPMAWSDHDRRPLDLPPGRVRSTIFHFGRGDLFFDAYRREIIASDNVTACVYANVVELEASPGGEAIRSLRVACLPGGTFVLFQMEDGVQRTKVAPLERSEFRVEAKLFVLAAGGTEIPRLLLASTKVHPKGVGNDHDLVGRFFMEHPHLWSGTFIPSDASRAGRAGFYQIERVRGVPVMAKLRLDEKTLREERLLNYCVSLHPKTLPPRSVDAAARFARAISRRRLPRHALEHARELVTGSADLIAALRTRGDRRRDTPDATPRYRRPVHGFLLNHMSEQVPNPQSRVTLAEERDALGVPLVRLEWRVTRQDIRTIIRAQEILDEELRRAGVGRVHIDLDDDAPPPRLHGGWHHMGTTRMAVDPKQGVVDATSRVHGIKNLYVAGPSVFPTGGFANPSLTIGALALRLADQIAKEMASSVQIGAAPQVQPS